jgi:threonine dehydrogenase-like Zn-dependent dehydrogenase
MRAAVFEAVGRLAMVERPAPRPPEGAVRVQVDACGICGTDVHIFRGEFPGAAFPLVAGHEFSGVVEATGAGVSHLRAGDQVAVDPSIYCGVADAPGDIENDEQALRAAANLGRRLATTRLAVE